MNCADVIEWADPEEPTSLGPDMPGCQAEGCENGMYPPCDVETPYEGSAIEHIEWPEVEVTDLIP